MFSSRVSAKSKVTSGRLTGAGKVQTDRARGTPKSRPKPAYSLHSTDSEDQVATLHKGLDRCAALLNDILHSENAEAGPKQEKTTKDGAAKSRPHTPTGKKAIRRSVSKSVSNPRNAQMVRKKSTTPQRSGATPHSGVKLHPPLGKHHLLKALSKPRSPQPQRSPGPLTALDCVPVKDQGPAGVSGWDKDRSPEDESRMKRVQCLLGELRTLMTGQGDSAQTYLCLLEQSVSSSLNTETNQNQTETQTKEMENLNTQLQRQVKVLDQQLQDKEAAHQLLNSQVSILQEKLSAAEKELTQVEKTLQETQRRLQNREEEDTGIKSELESTMNRLRVTLQDKFKLEATVQKKQQEIEGLHRIIDSYDSSNSTLEHPQVYPPEGAKDHITQYLLSIRQNRPSLPDHSIHHKLTSDGTRVQGPEGDGDSVISNWTVQSESTFNTRDEAAFRDGLAALDASIASLQKTLKMDLVQI